MKILSAGENGSLVVVQLQGFPLPDVVSRKEASRNGNTPLILLPLIAGFVIFVEIHFHVPLDPP